jgi:RNA-directed DNA polymerase
LTEGRRPPRKRAPDTVGSAARTPTSRRGIAHKAKADKPHRFRDLYRGLNVELLLECWGDLNKDAASGVDGVTWHAYAENLQANVEVLVERLKQKRYRAKLSRRRDLPQGNGQERPFGMPVIDDTLLQAACTRSLNAIDEQELLACSDGYRPERGAGAAVRDLTCDLQYGRYVSVVEVDIKGLFDHMDHDWLLEMRRLRIDDRALLGLIRKWLQAGILETAGRVIHPDTGVPQGGVVSPVRANVYLY